MVEAAMKHSEAIVATTQGASYLRRLCDHWAHQFTVETNEIWGRVLLPQTICKLVATSSSLLIQLEVAQDADQKQIEKVIEDHLHGLAGQDEISVAWRRR